MPACCAHNPRWRHNPRLRSDIQSKACAVQSNLLRHTSLPINCFCLWITEAIQNNITLRFLYTQQTHMLHIINGSNGVGGGYHKERIICLCSRDSGEKRCGFNRYFSEYFVSIGDHWIICVNKEIPSPYPPTHTHTHTLHCLLGKRKVAVTIALPRHPNSR